MISVKEIYCRNSSLLHNRFHHKNTSLLTHQVLGIYFISVLEGCFQVVVGNGVRTSPKSNIPVEETSDSGEMSKKSDQGESNKPGFELNYVVADLAKMKAIQTLKDVEEECFEEMSKEMGNVPEENDV
uniref:Sterol 3-beta-glucosyltransferase n=1 Tax=Lygus hesperus TaxID=30085 RepID=A0A0A9WWG4_LYGHE